MRFYDLHCHTKLSLCAARDSEMERFLEYADADGLEAIGFSDHAWDNGVGMPTDFYKAQNYERLYERAVPKGHKTRAFLGAEGEYAQGVLGVRAETIDRLDYIIIPHSHTHMKQFVLPEGCESPHAHGRYVFNSFVSLLNHPVASKIFGVAHPFSLCGKNAEETDEILSAITDEEFVYCGKLAKEKGIFLEMNASSVTIYPIDKAEESQYGRFFRNAQKGGAQFFMGSDNHSPVPHGKNKLFRLPDYMEAFGLDEGNFTSAIDRILRG